MSRRANGLYRSNSETLRLHERILQLQRAGLVQQKIAETIPVSASTVRYHLENRCNCRNGRRALTSAGAQEVRKLQAKWRVK